MVDDLYKLDSFFEMFAFFDRVDVDIPGEDLPNSQATEFGLEKLFYFIFYKFGYFNGII